MERLQPKIPNRQGDHRASFLKSQPEQTQIDQVPHQLPSPEQLATTRTLPLSSPLRRSTVFQADMGFLGFGGNKEREEKAEQTAAEMKKLVAEMEEAGELPDYNTAYQKAVQRTGGK